MLSPPLHEGLHEGCGDTRGYTRGLINPPPPPRFQGDLKRYLRAQRGAGGGTPTLPPRDAATLQRLGLEVTRGLRHLHRHGLTHRWGTPIVTPPL